jgi:hydrogenase maturation protein HypF
VPGTTRVRIRVTGTVQGVGFRPFVYRSALELGLAGHVLNDERGVVIEAEGPETTIGELAFLLEHDPPPLADVESVTAQRIEPEGETGFQILPSLSHGQANALVSADMATRDAFRFDQRSSILCAPHEQGLHEVFGQVHGRVY